MRFATRIFNGLTLFLAVLVVAFAILINVIRFSVPLLDNHRNFFQQWVSHIVKSPVKIGKISARWHGFSPIIDIQNTVILSRKGHGGIIRLRHFSIAIDVLESLLTWELRPADLRIDGTSLRVYQKANNEFVVPGVDAPLTADKTLAGHSDVLMPMLSWLLTQAEVSVNHVTLVWHAPGGVVIPVGNVQLKVTNHARSHVIVGVVSLSQTVPTRLRFVAHLANDDLEREALSGRLFVNVEHLQLRQWFSIPAIARVLTSFQVQNGTAHGTIWANWQNGHLTYAQSTLAFDHMGLGGKALTHALLVNHLSMNMDYQREQHGFRVRADQVLLRMNGQDWPKSAFAYQESNDPNHLYQTISLRFLRLGDVEPLLKDLAVLPNAAHQSLLAYQPSGDFSHLQILHMGSTWPGQYRARGQFSQASARAVGVSPGFNHLTGSFWVTPSSGVLTLNTSNASLSFPHVFSKPLTGLSLATRLDWYRQDKAWQVAMSSGKVSDGNVGLNAHMQLRLPDTGSPRLDLLSDFSLKNSAKIKTYLPDQVLTKKLVHWLATAFPAGHVDAGKMIYRGELSSFPYLGHEGRFQIVAPVLGAQLHYANGWPDLMGVDAQLSFDDDGMQVLINQGTLLGASLKGAKAYIDDLDGSPLLRVNGHITGDLSEGQAFLATAPIAATRALGAINMHGPLSLDLALNMPLEDIARATFDGRLHLAGAHFQLPAYGARLSNLVGGIHFTQSSISAPALKATLNDIPVRGQIVSVKPKKGIPFVQVSVGGHTSLSSLPYLSGDTDFRALLNIYSPAAHRDNSLNVLSDLHGVSVALPKPLYKRATQARHVALRFHFGRHSDVTVHGQYGQSLTAAMTIKSAPKGWYAYSAELRYGRGRATLQTEPGLLVYVDTLSLDTKKWQSFIGKQTGTGIKGLSLKPRLIDLRFDHALVWGQTLSQFDLKLRPIPQGWFAVVTSDKVAGQLTIPAHKKMGVLHGEFKRFTYTPPKISAKTVYHPASFPPVQLTFDQLIYAKQSLGKVRLDLTPIKDGVHIKTLKIASNNLHANMMGDWREDQHGHQHTAIEGKLSWQNLGLFLHQWDWTDALAEGVGGAGVALDWPASPQNFSMAKSTGNVNLDLSSGRVLKIGNNAQSELGLGRVLNLLSLQSLPRRLFFNFGDLSKKGFVFDHLKGSFHVKGGVLTTQSISCDGPVASVSMKGRIGLANKTYDVDLTVVPHVTESLPFLATITGGPVIGAVTWVVNKLFVSPVVGKAAMVHYHITGPWKQPKVVKI